MRKESKKRFASEVVAHLDTEEEQEVAPGAMLAKTWKVKNIGAVAWSEETVAAFTKGTEEVVSADMRIAHVGLVDPNEVCYIRSIFQAPQEPGKYKVVFRLNSPEAGKFGAPMISKLIVVEPEKPESEDEEIVAEVEELYEQENEPEPEPFKFQGGLDTLVAMGFPAESAKPVLFSVEGDVRAALDILMN